MKDGWLYNVGATVATIFAVLVILGFFWGMGAACIWMAVTDTYGAPIFGQIVLGAIGGFAIMSPFVIIALS